MKGKLNKENFSEELKEIRNNSHSRGPSKFADYFNYFYECGPIDFFDAFMPYSSYILYGHEDYSDSHFEEILNDKLKLLSYASQLLARISNWQGDIRNGEKIYVFPVEIEYANLAKVAIVFKQDHDGQTFILSPVKLDDFLKDYLEQRQIWAEGYYDYEQGKWVCKDYYLSGGKE
jgi:hypothetical protein